MAVATRLTPADPTWTALRREFVTLRGEFEALPPRGADQDAHRVFLDHLRAFHLALRQWQALAQRYRPLPRRRDDGTP
jgi:hypothetical protein